MGMSMLRFLGLKLMPMRVTGRLPPAHFAAHGEKRDILKFGMAFYKKNLVVCKDLPK